MQKILYNLVCDHVASGPPTLVSGLLFCPWDGAESVISGVHVYEWRAHCESCGWSKWCGIDARTAGYLADGHYRKHFNHSVYPEYVINPDARKTQEKMDAWHATKQP
jgi:hypothetical protein